MKTTFFYFFLFLCLIQCNKKPSKITENNIKISNNLHFTKDKEEIKIFSNNKHFFLKKNKIPLKKVVLLNASLVGYFVELAIQDRIIGITSPEYIYNEDIKKQIKNEKISIVGNDQKLDIEKIISLNPDAIFTNYIPTHDIFYKTIKKNGIEIIFLDEYLEQNPLEKSSYLKLFGSLFGKEEFANKKFENIENNYFRLKKIAENSPIKNTVMANEMYGNIWYMPAGQSLLAKLIKDAGGKYILENEAGHNAISLSFEKALVLSKNATVWVNAGNYSSKKNLPSQYKLLNAYQKGTIFSLKKAQKEMANNYFEEGNVRADWVLRDYIIALHPSLFPKDSLRYLHELK